MVEEVLVRRQKPLHIAKNLRPPLYILLVQDIIVNKQNRTRVPKFSQTPAIAICWKLTNF